MMTEEPWNWFLGNLTLQSFSIIKAIENPTTNELIAASASLMVVVGTIILVALIT